MNLRLLEKVNNLIRFLTKKILDFIFPKSYKTEKFLEKNLEKIQKLKNPETNEIFGVKSFWIFSYKDPLVKIFIKEIKYYKNFKLLEKVSDCLYEELIPLISDESFFKGFEEIFIVPIPESKDRTQKEGYSPTSLLSQLIAKKLQCKSVKLLEKIKETPRMASLKRSERFKVIENAFCVKKSNVPKNSLILILDDVITTGATLKESKRALYKEGYKKIIFISVARA